MKDIILMIIGLGSISWITWTSVKAFYRGEYNPYIFRLRTGYEWNVANVMSYFGFYLSCIFIQNISNKFFCFFTCVMVYCVTTGILNYKCYKIKKDRRIVVETIIADIILMALIAWMYTYVK